MFNRLFDFDCKEIGLTGVTEDMHKPLKYETHQMIENWPD